MSSKSTKEAWSVSAEEFGKSLKGFGINLLVKDMGGALTFAKDILEADILYWNEDFAALRRGEVIWQLHTDHTYSDNSYLGIVQGQEARGTGVELHFFDLDPDAAEARAREKDYIVLNGSMDKPHGLRECYIIDPEGYCWVASRPLNDEEAKAFR